MLDYINIHLDLKSFITKKKPKSIAFIKKSLKVLLQTLYVLAIIIIIKRNNSPGIFHTFLKK